MEPDNILSQFDLSRQVAVITGGGGFLGLRFAETILELGGSVLLLDQDEDALKLGRKRLNAHGDRTATYPVDVSNNDSVTKVVERIQADYVSIDILINAAGLTKVGMEQAGGDAFAPFENTNQEQWDSGLKVNLTGTQIMCKHVGRLMADQRRGSIINIASDIGVISPDQRIYRADDYGYEGVQFNSPAVYAVSKAGVIHLTKFLATYWASLNIRVNSISPAGVYRDHSKAFEKKLSEKIPLGRMAKASELKGAVAFLASDASSFVTGHNLMVDGGRTIW